VRRPGRERAACDDGAGTCGVRRPGRKVRRATTGPGRCGVRRPGRKVRRATTGPGRCGVRRRGREGAEVRGQPPRPGRSMGVIRSVPSQGCSASGTWMEPSARWWFSRRATRVRPTATPEPLSVWTWRGLPPSSGR